MPFIPYDVQDERGSTTSERSLILGNNLYSHHSYSQVRIVKKMQDETEGAVRTLSSRSSKRAPTWHSSPITPKTLSGQPNPDPIQRLARKGFWGNGWAMSCGGSFRSSWWERSHSAFSFVLHFFYHPNLALGTMCAGLWLIICFSTSTFVVKSKCLHIVLMATLGR